ncbi:unnamed protein product [Symbiodinium necroappetens]|uniref:Transposase Tc1-like domain-containing protein n=1 Tax=Symbiodinium necroappetens TaxID=1628268 RepID=A0A813C552_9DINO|nr:unnamed protein product [Symbiodinium necroappetens]
MSADERKWAKTWYSEGKQPSEIAGLLGRDTSSIARLLCVQKPVKKQGRPSALTKAQIDFLERKLDQMIVKADGQHTVTVEMLQKAAKIKASSRTILRALHERNIFFRKLREKPVLTPEDVRDRFQFAKTYRNKTGTWWANRLDAFIDGKHFQVYLNSKASGTLQGVPAGDGPCHEYAVAGSSETVVNLFEEAQEPFNAGAWVKRWQKAEVLASASDPGNKKKGRSSLL